MRIDARTNSRRPGARDSSSRCSTSSPVSTSRCRRHRARKALHGTRGAIAQLEQERAALEQRCGRRSDCGGVGAELSAAEPRRARRRRRLPSGSPGIRVPPIARRRCGAERLRPRRRALLITRTARRALECSATHARGRLASFRFKAKRGVGIGRGRQRRIGADKGRRRRRRSRCCGSELAAAARRSPPPVRHDALARALDQAGALGVASLPPNPAMSGRWRRTCDDADAASAASPRRWGPALGGRRSAPRGRPGLASATPHSRPSSSGVAQVGCGADTYSNWRCVSGW